MVSTDVFGGGSGPVFLDSVECRGSEAGLLECAHTSIGSHACGQDTSLTQSGHLFDVAIICNGKLSWLTTH